MSTRIRSLVAALVGVSLALGACALDAGRRREDGKGALRAREALAARLGQAELALSSGARWLRNPGSVEASAAFSDAPGALDVDPAGAWIAPPRAVLGAHPLRLTVRPGGR